MSLDVNRKLDRILNVILPLFLFSAALILRLLNYSGVNIYPDEYIYEERALATINSNWAWRVEYMQDQPPLHMYILSAFVYFCGSQLENLRLISVVAGSLSVIFTYLLGKAIFDRKVGFISGAVLAFSGFHILYSRLAQQEALTLLFILGAIYFFWMGVIRKRNMTHSLLGGIFLGLAMDTKYVTLLFYVSLILFFFIAGQDWRKLGVLKPESKRLLLGRPFIVYLSISILVFAPVILTALLNGVNPFYWQLIGRFENYHFYYYRTYALESILFSGISSYVTLLTYVSSLNPEAVFPLYGFYEFLATILFFFVVSYFLRALLKMRDREIFIFLLFIVPVLFFIYFPNKFQYYQLYTFTGYPIMLAYFAVRTGRSIRGATGKLYRIIKLKLIPIIAVLISVLVLSMGFVGGAISAQKDEGAYTGFSQCMEYIKRDYVPGAYIGTSPSFVFVNNYLSKYDINATVVYLVKLSTLTQPPSVRAYEVPILTEGIMSGSLSLDSVHIFKPQFLILHKDEYDLFFTTPMKMDLAKQYHIVLEMPAFILLERYVAN